VVVLGEMVETLDRECPLGAQKSALPSLLPKKEGKCYFPRCDEVVFQPCESSGSLLPPKLKTALVKFRVWDKKKFEIAKGQEREHQIFLPTSTSRLCQGY
jgi:hypothetical protein